MNRFFLIISALTFLACSTAFGETNLAAEGVTNGFEYNFEELISMSPDLVTNSIDIDFGLDVRLPELVVADFAEEEESSVSVFRRAEVVFFLAVPFAALYTYFSMQVFDEGEFFGTDVAPFREKSGLENSGKYFALITAVLWAVSITRDDIARVYSKRKFEERINRNYTFSPSIDFEREKDGSTSYTLGFTMSKAIN